MTRDELISNYPCLYHMAEAEAWDSIRRFGLRSTTALLDLFEIKGEARAAIELQHRPKSVTIRHASLGIAVIRDQKPMSDKALGGCLEDMSVSQWYQLLNRKVFFWLTRERLMKLLAARAYRDLTHCVLTLDTAAVLSQHADEITLSAINSGSTIYKPQRRGQNTFLPIAAYPFDLWSQKRGRSQAVVELAVEYSVPEINKLVLKVEHVHADKVTAVLFESKKKE